MSHPIKMLITTNIFTSSRKISAQVRAITTNLRSHFFILSGQVQECE